MRDFIRTGLAGLLLAGATSCTGVIGNAPSGGGGNSNSGNGGGVGSGNGGSSSSGSGGSGSGSGSGSSSGSGTGSSSGSGTGSSSGSGSGGSSGVDGGSTATITCSPGIPATTQLRRILNTEYDRTVNDLLGVTSVTAPEGTGLPSTLLVADFEGAMTADAWRIYQDVGAAIADQVMGSSTLKSNFISCDPSASGCLQQTIQTFGRKAFRRQLTSAEVSNFMALNSVTPAGTPTQVAQAILQAFLESPSFIM